MTNATLRWLSYRPFGAELRRRVKSLQAIQPPRWAEQRIQMYVPASMLAKGIPSFTRTQKFSFGVALAIWPVLMMALLPSGFLNSLDSIFCVAGVLSEAAAFVLFVHLRRRRHDRLTFWSTIAAAVAGEVTLAFLIAAAVIAMHAS